MGLHFLYPLLRGLTPALCNLFSVSLALDPNSVNSSASMNGPGTSERSLRKEWNGLGGCNSKRLCLHLGLGVWVKPEGHHSHWVGWLLAWVCENHRYYSFSLSTPLAEGNWVVVVGEAFFDSHEEWGYCDSCGLSCCVGPEAIPVKKQKTKKGHWIRNI